MMPPYTMLRVWFVPELALSILTAIRIFFRSRGDTALEILGRQQVTVLKRKCPRFRPSRLERLPGRHVRFDDA